MSIVIAAINNELCHIAADSRCTDIDSNGNFVVLTESFKKVGKLFDNVAIGFAGGVAECRDVVQAVAEICNKSLTKQFADIVASECFDYILKQHLNNPLSNIQMLIGGKCSDGRMRLHQVICSPHVDNHRPILEVVESNHSAQWQYMVISSLRAEDPFVDQIMQLDGRITDKMAHVITIASRKNPTINNNIRWADVRL